MGNTLTSRVNQPDINLRVCTIAEWKPQVAGIDGNGWESRRYIHILLVLNAILLGPYYVVSPPVRSQVVGCDVDVEKHAGGPWLDIGWQAVGHC